MNQKNILSEMPQRNPINGTFELTVRCNLKCKMCLFRHDDSENTEIMEKELTTEQWIDMAKQVADAGTMNLLITGGEPMLRPDFCEIWEGIYKQGFLISLYTNASLVNEKIMQTLRRYPPHKIGVTLYGASSETYEKVCGNPDAFCKAIEGMRQLYELPSKMDFRTTIIKDNYADVDEMARIIQNKFGMDNKLIQTRVVMPAVRGACADVKSCRLDPEENVRLAYHRGINLIKKYVGDSYDEKNLYIEYINGAKDRLIEPKFSLLGCEAGLTDYTISWDGRLLGCQMLGEFSTNAVENGFFNAWIDFPKQIKLPPVNEKCGSCQNKDLCNCCWASRIAETGKLDGCPEYLCRDTEIVKQMLDKGGIYNV